MAGILEGTKFLFRFGEWLFLHHHCKADEMMIKLP